MTRDYCVTLPPVSACSVVAVSGQAMAASLSKNAFNLARSKGTHPLRSLAVASISASMHHSQIFDHSRLLTMWW